jgi:glycerol-3-phosphate dehydrogenase (NAD(P)+)
MTPTSSKIAVIGAGAWGTTLAMLLAENKHQVILWAYEPELAKEMSELRENRTFLPGFQLSDNITITSRPEQTRGAEFYVFAVPTKFLRQTSKRFRTMISKQPILSASKGIEERTLELPLELLSKELGTKKLAALSGPNLSAEIARGQPAATVVASRDDDLARSIQELFRQERFRVYVNTDPLGVQLGGALKNVIAIAAGVADGLELGNNAKAGLMIRGISEITRLGVALGASAATFAGLSGMGDLITTCSSRLSRNHRVGEQLAQGRKLTEILAGMKDVAEGVTTVKAALALGEKHRVVLPMSTEVYRVLYEDKDPLRSISDLMTRIPTSE